MNDLKIKVSDIQAEHEKRNFFEAIGEAEHELIANTVRSIAIRSDTARSQDLLDAIAKVAENDEISLARLMTVCIFHGRVDLALQTAQDIVAHIAGREPSA